MTKAWVGKHFHFPHHPLGKEQGQFERSFKFKLCFLVSSSSFKGKLESIFYSVPFFLVFSVNTNDYWSNSYSAGKAKTPYSPSPETATVSYFCGVSQRPVLSSRVVPCGSPLREALEVENSRFPRLLQRRNVKSLIHSFYIKCCRDDSLALLG